MIIKTLIVYRGVECRRRKENGQIQSVMWCIYGLTMRCAKRNERLSTVSVNRTFIQLITNLLGANSTNMLLLNASERKPYTISIATNSVDGVGDESSSIRVNAPELIIITPIIVSTTPSTHRSSSPETIISYKEGILIGAFITFLGFIVCSCILFSRTRFVPSCYHLEIFHSYRSTNTRNTSTCAWLRPHSWTRIFRRTPSAKIVEGVSLEIMYSDTGIPRIDASELQRLTTTAIAVAENEQCDSKGGENGIRPSSGRRYRPLDRVVEQVGTSNVSQYEVYALMLFLKSHTHFRCNH